jgi:hypothetical protein
MSIRCPICSKENPDSQEFCALCGTALQNVAGAAKELSPEDVDEMLSQPAPVVPAEPAPIERSTPPPAVEPLQRDTNQKVSNEPAYPPLVDRKAELPVEIEPRQLPSVKAAPPAETPPIERMAPPVSLPPPKPTSRRWSPRCVGFGCLGTLIFLLVGVPLLYFFLARPPIERSLIGQIEERIGQTFTIAVYSGPAQTSAASQNKVNTLIQPFWDEKFSLKEGQITLTQDALRVETRWLFIPIEITADVRAGSNGALVVKSLQLNWPARLLFTPDSLSTAITRYVNDEILRPKNIFLLAFQVTDGDLFLAWRSR